MLAKLSGGSCEALAFTGEQAPLLLGSAKGRARVSSWLPPCWNFLCGKRSVSN